MPSGQLLPGNAAFDLQPHDSSASVLAYIVAECGVVCIKFRVDFRLLFQSVWTKEFARHDLYSCTANVCF